MHQPDYIFHLWNIRKMQKMMKMKIIELNFLALHGVLYNWIYIFHFHFPVARKKNSYKIFSLFFRVFLQWKKYKRNIGKLWLKLNQFIYFMRSKCGKICAIFVPKIFMYEYILQYFIFLPYYYYYYYFFFSIKVFLFYLCLRLARFLQMK